MNRILSFVSGALLGAVVGGTLALLFTPSSGDDLLMRIEGRANEIRREMRQAAEGRRAELEAQLAELRTPRRPTGSV